MEESHCVTLRRLEIMSIIPKTANCRPEAGKFIEAITLTLCQVTRVYLISRTQHISEIGAIYLQCKLNLCIYIHLRGKQNRT